MWVWRSTSSKRQAEQFALAFQPCADLAKDGFRAASGQLNRFLGGCLCLRWRGCLPFQRSQQRHWIELESTGIGAQEAA